MAIALRAYLSPTLVLLAFDWPEGAGTPDFLGFAIKREPGFDLLGNLQAGPSWLPNRIGFNGPPAEGLPDFPSNEAPIQKFMWWDSRVTLPAAGTQLTYTVYPVLGSKESHDIDVSQVASLTITLPPHVENGVGSYFNRAVVRSQAFDQVMKALGVDPSVAPSPENELKLREWLGNGMEQAVPDFIQAGGDIEGAIYHLTDELFIIPALTAASTARNVRLVYDAHTSTNAAGDVVPSPNQKVIDDLGAQITFKPRTKTNIMHDKFLVRGASLTNPSPSPVAVTMGSANYTTEGLSEQANLVHSFESNELAMLYLERALQLENDPAKAATAAGADWSNWLTVGDVGVRAFFSPEPTGQRKSIDRIVEAILSAHSSVIFCLFDPTDKPLRDAAFAAADNGKMMFGLVNRIADSEPVPGHNPPHADELAAMELYHRSRDNKDVIDAEYFHPDTLPAGFQPEFRVFPGEQLPPYPEVIIHHKFVVIDAEGESPIIFSGSQNLSKNSVNNNDENLLEMRSKRIAGIYLAEFLRLYEHYRARAAWNARKKAELAGHPTSDIFQLATTSSWASKHYQPGTPEYKARLAMVAP